MALLYADENFDFDVVLHLRSLGHDILRAQDSGQANKKIPDDQVLSFATILGRTVLTHNRRDFINLHKQSTSHEGIVVCTVDDDGSALAQRIHQALLIHGPLAGKLIRVNKPAIP